MVGGLTLKGPHSLQGNPPCCTTKGEVQQAQNMWLIGCHGDHYLNSYAQELVGQGGVAAPDGTQ
jgi:hypothetical protein